MNIPLKPDVNPFRQRPYRLNPNYKEKLKVELDKIIVVGIIELVEESESVHPWWCKRRRLKEKLGSVLI